MVDKLKEPFGDRNIFFFSLFVFFCCRTSIGFYALHFAHDKPVFGCLGAFSLPDASVFSLYSDR